MDEVRYQVFVSSTFSDLKDERAKVLQAILQRKAFPAGMELFPAADEEQFEFIKREIDSSDYYIVIIAGRYGSVDNAGLSFTEKEYDYAKDRGKPVLAFLHKDIGKLIGDKLESSDDGKKKLEAFREKARKSKLVAHYENPDELKSEVFYALVSQFDLRPMRGWVHAGQTPRVDLEAITRLQQRVLDLEAENKQLRELQDDAVTQLASGSEPIIWSLDLNDFAFDNKYLTQRSVEIESTWDQMLVTAFPGGSSSVASDELRRRITAMIVESVPTDAGSPEWFEKARTALKTWQIMPFFKSVDKVLSDLHRQFAGLGLTTESTETIYVPQQFGAPPTPKTASVWKLTPKGERHLALVYGFRRSD